jgi:hypothetical protein
MKKEWLQKKNKEPQTRPVHRLNWSRKNNPARTTSQTEAKVENLKRQPSTSHEGKMK